MTYSKSVPHNLHGSIKQFPYSVTSRILMNLEAQMHQLRCRLERTNDKTKEFKDLDLVTGLPDYSGFVSLFESEINRVKSGESYGGTLVFVDIDNYNNLFDLHGRYVLSLCLKQTADILMDEYFYKGKAAYVGQGEFAVLLPDISKQTLIEQSQNVRGKIDNISFQWQNQHVTVKSSVGLHAYSASDCVKHVFSKFSRRQTKGGSVHKNRFQQKAQY